MSLRLIYGRAGSGKSHFCLNEIKSRLDEGALRPLILLVPEQFSLQTEKNLISTLSNGGTIGAEVLSFRRMAHRVFGEVGGVARKHINSSGKCMLIHRVIEDLKGELKFFARAAGQRGFVNTLSDLIAELKRYNITPEVFRMVGEQLKDQPLLRDKMKEISAIYQGFESTLHQRYIDSDDDLTLMAEKLERSTQFEGAEIWIDEFSGFTPQEYRVIEKLLGKAQRVNVCLCTDCLVDEYSVYNNDVFAPAKNTAKKLIDLAREMGVEVEKPVVFQKQPFPRFKDSRELSHLEHYCFSFPYNTYKGRTKDISIFAAVNIYSEVENTARDILRLCREQGLRYRDIAVVSRNLAGYEKLVAAIFTEYGIPYFIDSKRDITSHPLVMLILSVLEIFIHNWSYESVFRYLKTGLTGLAREDIDVLENYVLACGIRGNRWIQEDDWDFRPNAVFEQEEMADYEKKLLVRVNEIRRRVTGPLIDFRTRTKGRTKAREICTALYELLCRLEVPERIEERMEYFKAAGELELANEYSQIWNIVMEVFDQIVETMGEDSMGVERFSNVLAIGFGEYKIGLIPPALDQVLVGSVERSRSHEIKALYILGVNDGVFPAPSDDEGILTDRDRQVLRGLGVELAQDTRAKAFEEQYMIYTALTTAGRCLRLSYPVADHEGRTMRPSIIISRLKKLFPEICEYSDIIQDNSDQGSMNLVTSPIPTFNELVSVIRKQAEGLAVSPLWKDVYRWYISREDWKKKCEAAISWLHYSNQAGAIDPEKVRKLYGSPIYTSISRLERFASCPFSFYMQYGLIARERKIFSLSPPDLGTFMHKVIDTFSRRLESKGMTWRELDREWCAREVSDIVEGFLNNKPGTILGSSQRYRYLTGRLKRVLTRAVWVIAQHITRSGFEPIGYEVDFGEGKESKFPPIVIELSTGDKIHLVGRIDRVDALKTGNGTYIRVVDYKSGSKAFKLSDVYYGLQIQLLAYLDAIWENGCGDIEGPVRPGGILYFKVDDPIVRTKGDMEEEEIEKAIMKKLKMNGLILADVKLVKEMDHEIDGDSMIIPARINKDGRLGRSSAATMNQFEALRKYVKRLLVEIGEEMVQGNVAIRPYKNKKLTACKYCSYSPVCQFDPTFQDNQYRFIHDIKDDEVWNILADVDKEDPQ